MSSPQTQHQPSPALLFDTMNAYQRTAALKGAIDLGLFTAIGEGNQTPAAIAKQIGGTERATRVLCDFLTIIGFLNKEDGRYGLTQDSALFLDKRSPAYLGSVAGFLGKLGHERFFADVAELVRQGHTLVDHEGSMEPENPLWVEFAHSMAPMMNMPAQVMARMASMEAGQPCRILDIAAGHGLFGITMAQQNPNAEVTAVDWAAVLAVAAENATKRGVAGRFHQIPGSAFTVDFGAGYDWALVTNFFHHFDIPTCEGLLRKIRASLKDNGAVMTLEFVPNPDRVSPPSAATFSMMMLGTTVSGDAYTFAEYDSMMRNAGFSRNEIHSLEPLPQSVIVSRV